MKIHAKVLRLASLVFFITLLALPFSTYAQSGNDIKVTIENAKGSVGQVVDVPVKISEPNKDIAVYGMEINFNPKDLKVLGIKSAYGVTSDDCANGEDGCFWSNFNNEEGFLRTAWADPTAGDNPIEKGGVLFTIQVEILNADLIGETALTINEDNPESLSFTDPTNQPLTVTVAADTGKFTIVEAEKSETKLATSDKENEQKNNKGLLPKTGDDSYIDTLLNSAIVLIAAILFAMWFRKKRKNVEQNN